MTQLEQSSRGSPPAGSFIQSALDALTAHIAILDENGIIIGVNTAWNKFADDNRYKGADHGIGANYLDVCDKAAGINAKEAPLVANGLRRIMADPHRDFYLEYPCHGPGIKRWFVMHVTCFEWEGKYRYIVAHQNVTELKVVQLALAESKQRIQAIVDNVINGIVTLDQHAIIESVNPAMMEIFGYQALEELIGQPLQDLLAEPQNTLAAPLLIEQLQHTHNHETLGYHSDGTEFPIYIALNPVMLGKRQLYIGIVQDITERKRMEAELLEKERLRIELEKERELRDLKNRFIAMMSHELRTPLASIMLSGDMLKVYGEQASDEEKLMYLENIRVQVEQITELIQDVQTINRSSGPNGVFLPELVDIVTYVHGIVEEFQLTHHKTHKIIFETTLTELYTMFDRKLMRRIVNNLLSNAIKYSGEGGTVKVFMGNGKRRARLIVTDSGIGIPGDDLKRLFEPFHRATNVDQIPGTGLGLSITKQAVELHHGTIEVDSSTDPATHGTTVTVTLPVILE